MDYDELFPGRFLKSGQFKGRDVTLTVKGIRIEKLPQEKGGDRAKGIVSFAETELEWVLNRTNGECVKAMFGRNTDEWIGKKITLWPAPFVSSFGDSGEGDTCIRVRGSPELTVDKKIEIHLPRKKPIHMTMKSTRKDVKEPPHDPATGEVK